jgi:hypothetical protein
MTKLVFWMCFGNPVLIHF